MAIPRITASTAVSLVLCAHAGILGGCSRSHGTRESPKADRQQTVTDNKVPSAEVGQSGEGELSDSENALLRGWLRKDYSVATAAKVAACCLRHQLHRAEVIALIGDPSSEEVDALTYDFAPGQFLLLDLDNKRQVKAAAISGMPVDKDGKIWPPGVAK